jgi:cysteine desulfurase
MRIYLDHNATTPLREEVVEAMLHSLGTGFGNPSSTHAEGAHAGAAVERAREQVAECIGTAASAVRFTSGATEANNAVVRSAVGDEPASAHVVTTAVEHPSVEAPLALFESRGLRVTRLSVDEEGLVDLDELKAAVSEDTRLVTILWANNETGVIQPMAEIAAITRACGVPLHVDATQAIGKAHVDLRQVPADYLSSSAHKLNGPKGVGCLAVRDGAEVEPLILGGGQERGWRGGTENVASIVGYGVACELARAEVDQRRLHYGALRDRLWDGLRSRVAGVRRNGSAEHVLCNTLNVEFQGAPGEVLLQSLDLEGVAVSAGAACHSGAISPSRVLTAMGRSAEEARGSLRLSVGHGVDESQIDRALDLLASLVPRVREAGEL